MGFLPLGKKDAKDIATIFEKALILNKFLDSQQNKIEATDISHVPLTPHLGTSPITNILHLSGPFIPHDKLSLPPPPHQSLQVLSLPLVLTPRI